MRVAATVDLRSMFGPARDQGKRPTCLAFATSDTHAALRGVWQALSIEFAFYHAQRRAGRKPSDGATLPEMLLAIREDGQPLETGWPYLADTPTEAERWLPPTTATPVFRRAGHSVGGDVSAIISALNLSKPAIVLMQLSTSFFSVTVDGLIDESPGEKPDPKMRHAVIAIGHGTCGSNRVILVRNSWGPRWGDNGYAWITEKFLNSRIFGLAYLMEDISVSTNPVAA